MEFLELREKIVNCQIVNKVGYCMLKMVTNASIPNTNSTATHRPMYSQRAICFLFLTDGRYLRSNKPTRWREFFFRSLSRSLWLRCLSLLLFLLSLLLLRREVLSLLL